MATNIFEGGRRIVKFIALLWIISFILQEYIALRCITDPNGIICGDPNEIAVMAISGILFIWVFTWIIGWIVRGCMGIPRGKDQREK